MDKIKILYTIPNFDTAGSGKALLNIAAGLNKDLFEPQILCLHNRGEFFKEVEKSGIPIHIFDFIPKERPVLKMLKNCYDVSKKLCKIKPDIIHSFHYASNYTEAIAGRMSGAKWVFTKKNMSWEGPSKNGWKLRSALASKIVIQNSDMDHFFYPNSKKTFLIPRGVSIEKFKPQKPDSEIRRTLNTKEHQRVLICVANFVPVKGIEVLIEAFHILAPEFPDWILWLIGDDTNNYGQELHQKVNSFNLNNRVRFSGKQLNVCEYLDHAEIFVLPTLDRGEGSPVALLEAMANGKAVLGSRVPGIKDQLENFPEYVFSPGNVSELVAKLEKLMNKTREDLTVIGEKFQNFVIQEYDLVNEVNRHEMFYLSLQGRLSE